MRGKVGEKAFLKRKTRRGCVLVGFVLDRDRGLDAFGTLGRFLRCVFLCCTISCLWSGPSYVCFQLVQVALPLVHFRVLTLRDGTPCIPCLALD